MTVGKTEIFVYADWVGLNQPTLMGILSAHRAKGRKSFSFEYDRNWLNSSDRRLLDPDLNYYSGPQFPNDKENFGLFLDSMPDTWGRTLMRRREIQYAKEVGAKPRTLYDIDFLLGVFDETRIGALRYKLSPDGPFLDNNVEKATPPWSTVGALQNAVEHYENDGDNEADPRWLNMLIAPGSSLGGARPKANILDKKGELWIAKFPSKSDTIDKGAWEYLTNLLARNAGIWVPPFRIQKLHGNYHTFFTKRFDRSISGRIHFSSAMTMTGNTEDTVRDAPASYLDLVNFISTYGTNINENLKELWRRIIFNIAVSNTDDHLRNHGFLLLDKGWQLSPAYDLNPSIDKDGLSLNIDMDNNAMDFKLAGAVGEYFRLTPREMNEIIEKVSSSVAQWRRIAKEVGIPRSEQELMSSAFRVE